MKLGITYPVFSGLELLKPSLLNIRPLAHHIVLVWSPVSFTGDPAPKYLLSLITSLQQSGLADELIKYYPTKALLPIEMQNSYRVKCEVGRSACQAAGCSHHLIRDCDEFYSLYQLRSQMSWFDIMDVCISPIVEYVQTPTTRIKGVSGLYVPCIHKIECRIKRNNSFGVTVDLGRTVYPADRFKIFSPAELVLHHYTSVRINEGELRRKYQGHGHLNRVGTVNDFLNKVRGYDLSELEIAPDVFGIQEYWDGEFQQWLG